MAVEIFGSTITDQISVGDVAAIGALIASPLIFWFGYRRTVRTEEIKTVSDIMNKTDKAFRTVYEFYFQRPPSQVSDENKSRWFRLYLGYLNDLQMNIRYLTVLVQNKEIKAKHLVDHCRLHVTYYLEYLDEYYTWIEGDYKEFKKPDLTRGYHAEIPRLMKTWKQEKVSRWQKIPK